MGSFSVWHWLIVLVIVLVLFGRGKIPELMGDVAKGIKSFKKGMADEDQTCRRPMSTRRLLTTRLTRSSKRLEPACFETGARVSGAF